MAKRAVPGLVGVAVARASVRDAIRGSRVSSLSSTILDQLLLPPPRSNRLIPTWTGHTEAADIAHTTHAIDIILFGLVLVQLQGEGGHYVGSRMGVRFLYGMLPSCTYRGTIPIVGYEYLITLNHNNFRNDPPN